MEKKYSLAYSIIEFETIVRFIFSWIILMPISVIISGKLLAKPITLIVNSRQIFKISLGVLVIQSTDEEVILGFIGFIITLFITGVFGGINVYVFVKSHFGVDPGHFTSLCFFSSCLMVLWSFILFSINRLGSMVMGKIPIKEVDERNNIIDGLSKK